MQRMWTVGLAAAVMAVTAWVVVGRLRSRSRPYDLGTISDAWLSDPRNYPTE